MFGSPDSVESAPAGAGGVDGAVALLKAGIEALAAVPAGELPDVALSDALTALDPVLNRLDAARCSLLDAWDARVVWAADGARSGAGWLASHTELSRAAAASQIKAARALRAMPVTDAAFSSGALGSAKVRLLADTRVVAPKVFDAQEQVLVDLVSDLRVDEAAKVLALWRQLACPDGAAAAEEERYASRGFELAQTFGGVWVISGQLTPEQGEIIRNQIDPITKRLRAADVAAVEAGDLDAVRTARQLRADALILLVLQGSTAGEDGNPINVPSVTLIVNLADLADLDTDAGHANVTTEGAAGTEPGGAEETDGAAYPDDERTDTRAARPTPPVRTGAVGETEHGEPVSRKAALRHLCDASCARVVFGPDSVPVDLGQAARLPSPAQRRALAARDRGCTFPGCDLPPSWTNAHHLVHWIHGGPTDFANLALLCVHHHHRVHEGGFTVGRLANGTLEFRRPDGTPLTVPKQRAPNPHPPPLAA